MYYVLLYNIGVIYYIVLYFYYVLYCTIFVFYYCIEFVLCSGKITDLKLALQRISVLVLIVVIKNSHFYVNLKMICIPTLPFVSEQTIILLKSDGFKCHLLEPQNRPKILMLHLY